jgi:integral membrane protein (TIGR01906 family)
MTVLNSVRRSALFLSLTTLLITLLVPVLLALGSVRLIMTEPYLQIEYNKPDFPVDEYGFSTQDRLDFGPYAIRYLLNSSGIEYLGDLKFPDGLPLYTDRELSHMVDVKVVFQAAMTGLLAALILFVFLTAINVGTYEGRTAIRRGLFGGALLLFTNLVGLVLLIVLNWQTFFTGFHSMFFSSGTWVFDYSDTLIRLYPVRFWQDAALTVGGMAAVGALIVMAVVWQWSRVEWRTKQRANV